MLPFASSAHSTVNDGDMVAGMLHPVSGGDHLLAMLGVGMVSAIMGGRNIWLVPAVFVAAMLVGGVLGIYGFPVPFSEIGISTSILILGLATALVQKGFSTWLTFGFVFCFGIFHGNAHGIEMPKMANSLFYTIGFLLTTILIHVIGIFLGELMSNNRYARIMLYIIGISIAIVGFYFFIRTITAS